VGKTVRLVLPESAANGSMEPRYFEGFPGVWTPGEAQEVPEEQARLARELGLPLVEEQRKREVSDAGS
jgi:hypothetical protein